MTISLDTNVIVDVTRADPEVRARLRERLASPEPVVISSIVLEELEFGAQISKQPERQREQIKDALIGVAVEPLTVGDARDIALYRAQAERRGRRLSAYDGLIAGHAFARGWRLVTADAQMIANAVDLAIETWRAPS